MSRARDAPAARRRPVAVPTGNTFDKYGSTNPVVRRLMAGFEGTLEELFTRAAPESVLDVGCGEGVLTYQWAERLGEEPVVGIDLTTPSSRPSGRRAGGRTSSSARSPASDLPFADGEFDLAAAIEVLEHVPDPERTLAEMARVAARAPAGLGAPRAAVARAQHGPRRVLARAREHPGPRQSLVEARASSGLLGRHGEVVEARSPFPWTMLLVRVPDGR